MAKKMTFALAFCNRGFMPGELILGARREVAQAVEDAGYASIMMDEKATRFGGVETRARALCSGFLLRSTNVQHGPSPCSVVISTVKRNFAPLSPSQASFGRARRYCAPDGILKKPSFTSSAVLPDSPFRNLQSFIGSEDSQTVVPPAAGDSAVNVHDSSRPSRPHTLRGRTEARYSAPALK